MPFTDRATRVLNRRVAYVDEGPRDAPPLVLLHGAGFDHAELTWRLTVAAMRDHRRVIVPDLPGYGDSDALCDPCSLSDLGAWTVDFLDALELERVDLGGVSMGGGMALWVAIHAPDRVRRLVPVCAYGLMPRAPFHPAAYAFFRAGGVALAYRAAATSDRLARLGLAMSYGDPGRVSRKAVAELRRTAQDQMHRRSFDSFLAAELHRSSLQSDLTPELGRITAPTLLVAGTADRLVPAHRVRDAQEVIPDARYLALPTGHWPMRERPELFHPVLERFLSD
ncbi:3-oxoadipate enol-lactonase 2 [Rhodobacteraceae bacterium THAF1]|uniref:alpha/beta fold hydrolase n=1 Tax=Palleronia sp. THAF1 TaxID=2587842 RepID=UPI000F40885E|nr:alpha/beta fold hydrolase [Palleronia sp. THAF1]QFU08571.1 3-oxoadipate enol-lactonase 2 [Palleronia sp. THAF1]VDC30638.1 3-oxoadipate enol-lactonase 2 [Rhodobacteraceae bacterium THAF1]